MAAISTRVSSKRGIDDELAFLVLFAGSHLVEHVGDVVERGVILGVVTHAIRVDSSAFSASSQKPSPFCGRRWRWSRGCRSGVGSPTGVRLGRCSAWG